jgi:hypothetical protein
LVVFCVLMEGADVNEFGGGAVAAGTLSKNLEGADAVLARFSRSSIVAG